MVIFQHLGAFNKNSIRLSFACLVYPCLILAYLGQGAALITDGVNVLPNVFFSSIPGGTGSPFWWVNFVFGILAAVIASQALISGSYALVQQLARLHAIPPFKIISTSNSVRGQIYCPAVNYMLMLGSIGLGTLLVDGVSSRFCRFFVILTVLKLTSVTYSPRIWYRRWSYRSVRIVGSDHYDHYYGHLISRNRSNQTETSCRRHRLPHHRWFRRCVLRGIIITESTIRRMVSFIPCAAPYDYSWILELGAGIGRCV